MKFKTTTPYRVEPDVPMHEIMHELPTNAFINKGRCGIGGTMLEINNKTRSSIIIVPFIPIIESKLNTGIIRVDADVTISDICKELTSSRSIVKFMSTPEGLKKIMDAAIKLSMTEIIKNEWFLLLDECHTFSTEYFRPGILTPFNYFHEFKMKAIISATPFSFCDPRMSELHYHEITFTSKLGTVNLLNCKNPDATLLAMIDSSEFSDTNLHIFYNSVTAIAQVINKSTISDCNIFCANDNDGNNMSTLGELVKYYNPKPHTENYKQINFYTGRYFEGWDLFDANATIILITNTHNEHSMVGWAKSKQAVGRCRYMPAEIYHLTNHRYIKEIKKVSKLKKDFLSHATRKVINYNSDLLAGMYIEPNSGIENVADICVGTPALLNTYKVDQQVYQVSSAELYNHIDYIKLGWEKAFFNVQVADQSHKFQTSTHMKRKSKATQLQEDYNTLKDHYEHSSLAGIRFFIGDGPEKTIRDRNPTAVKAYHLLSEDELIKLKWNVKKITTEIITKENHTAELKLLKLLDLYFKVHEFYSNKAVQGILQKLYDSVGLKDSDGLPRKAKASDLGAPGRFELSKPTKRNKEHGCYILRKQFELQIAA